MVCACATPDVAPEGVEPLPLSTDWTVASVPAVAEVAVPAACPTFAVAPATACDTVVCTAVGDTDFTVGGAIGALCAAAAALWAAFSTVVVTATTTGAAGAGWIVSAGAAYARVVAANARIANAIAPRVNLRACSVASFNPRLKAPRVVVKLIPS
jgi:hypothetical protein